MESPTISAVPPGTSLPIREAALPTLSSTLPQATESHPGCSMASVKAGGHSSTEASSLRGSFKAARCLPTQRHHKRRRFPGWRNLTTTLTVSGGLAAIPFIKIQSRRFCDASWMEFPGCSAPTTGSWSRAGRVFRRRGPGWVRLHDEVVAPIGQAQNRGICYRGWRVISMA